MIRTVYTDIRPYPTKDGSEIRELMHPEVHGNRHQSLAEATVPSGTATHPHRHRETEELYHITGGTGRMTLEDERFPVTAGETICIPPGTLHAIENTGDAALTILCCCSPPYSHEDTDLSTEPHADGGAP